MTVIYVHTASSAFQNWCSLFASLAPMQPYQPPEGPSWFLGIKPTRIIARTLFTMAPCDSVTEAPSRIVPCCYGTAVQANKATDGSAEMEHCFKEPDSISLRDVIQIDLKWIANIENDAVLGSWERWKCWNVEKERKCERQRVNPRPPSELSSLLEKNNKRGLPTKSVGARPFQNRKCRSGFSARCKNMKDSFD